MGNLHVWHRVMVTVRNRRHSIQPITVCKIIDQPIRMLGHGMVTTWYHQRKVHCTVYSCENDYIVYCTLQREKNCEKMRNIYFGSESTESKTNLPRSVSVFHIGDQEYINWNQSWSQQGYHQGYDTRDGRRHFRQRIILVITYIEPREYNSQL